MPHEQDFPRHTEASEMHEPITQFERETGRKFVATGEDEVTTDLPRHNAEPQRPPGEPAFDESWWFDDVDIITGEKDDKETSEGNPCL